MNSPTPHRDDPADDGPGAHAQPGTVSWTGWTAWAPGTRVVVRRTLSAAERSASGQVWSDVIGIVVEVTDRALTLREDAGGSRSAGRSANTVVLAAAEITAGKVVPPRPPRRIPRHPVR